MRNYCRSSKSGRSTPTLAVLTFMALVVFSYSTPAEAGVLEDILRAAVAPENSRGNTATDRERIRRLEEQNRRQQRRINELNQRTRAVPIPAQPTTVRPRCSMSSISGRC